jgi:ABC-type uncharacterized transport system auxiliary subunit
MTRSLLLLRIASSVTLLLAGCISSRPIVVYTIDPPPPPEVQAKPDGPVLLVGAIVTPELLQDRRIRYRIGANETGAYEYHRWAERPGAMVQASLVGALRASGRYRRVLEASSAASGDYLLRGKLQEFGEVDRASAQAQINTKIAVQLELVDTKSNRVVWDRLIEGEEPVGVKDVAAVVQALDRNLQKVVSRTVADVDAFLSAAR